MKTFLKLRADTFRQRVRNLLSYSTASVAGQHHTAFRQKLKEYKGDYICTFAIDDGISEAIIVIDKDFRVATKPEREFEGEGDKRRETDESVHRRLEYTRAQSRVGWAPEITADFPVGAVHAAFMLGDEVSPAGFNAVLGPANAGKTPLCHAIAGYAGREYAFVAYGEPLSGYGTSWGSIAGALCQAIAEHDAVVLDSLKDLLTVAKGGAMKSGLSRGVFPIFTQLAVVAADAGCSLFVPINPSTQDEDVVDMLVEAIGSNATGIIAQSDADTSAWTYIFRTGEGLPRRSGQIKTGRDSEDFMTIDVQMKDGPVKRGNNSSQFSTFTGGVASSIGWDALHSLIRAGMRKTK